MRILTWNINGIGTLPKYYPWNTLKTCEAILDELNADIICFQEMKTSRRGLDASIATPGKYDGYFSFPVVKGGYSGVAVYSNANTLTALRAEEGLSGSLQPKPPFSANERISTKYPEVENMDLMADDSGAIPASLADMDKEGRALVLDFGLFVLINLYCVADSADIRYHYKMNYYFLLQERVRILIAEGREVIVLGDLNTCPSPMDHAEGNMPRHREGFYESPHRSWIRDWIGPEGPLVDIVRERWPNREGMYTCWNTKIGARDGNYGTRIDLILITPGLRKWIKDGDIQPLVKGSDHCPVYVDLHDSIMEDGREVKLRDMLHTPDVTDSREVPRICARMWDEYSSKQTLLSTFFTKRQPSFPTNADTAISPNPAVKPSALPHRTQELASPSPPSEAPTLVPTAVAASVSIAPVAKKRKATLDDSGQIKRAKLDRGGQSKLSSFFQKPSSSQVVSSSSKPAEAPGSRSSQSIDDLADAQFQRDIEIATMISQEESSSSTSVISKSGRSGSKEAWSNLLTPLQAPNCIVHGEPSKQFTVNKPGPNKGKTFFVCSRPVGPGYDMGKSKRDRSEVDTRYRCDFFQWAQDARKSMMQKGPVSQ